MKKKFFLVLFLTLFIFVCLLLVLFTNNKNGGLVGFPTPTPFSQNNTQEGARAGVPNNPIQQESDKRSFLVGLLVEKAPYLGKNFSLYYDREKGLLVLYINPNNKNAGNEEFEGLLKQNGILSKAWIDNLFIMYITPTPTTSNTSPTPAP